jgi:hypothetical protein
MVDAPSSIERRSRAEPLGHAPPRILTVWHGAGSPAHSPRVDPGMATCRGFSVSG